MADSEASGAPADWLIKLMKEQYEKFKKSRYAAPTAIAITALITYVMLLYMMNSCWIGLFPPLILFGLLWNFEIKRVRKLLLYGVIASVLIMLVATMTLTSAHQSAEPSVARSSGADPMLYDGVVNPAKGDSSTVYTYTITARLPNETYTLTNVNVIIDWETDFRNESMVLVDSNETSLEYFYAYSTTLSTPLNRFVFLANISDEWIIASDHSEDGVEIWAYGPISSDTSAIAYWVLTHYSLPYSFVNVFGVYSIICAMIWWTRRARRMREKAIKEWEEKRKKMEAKAPEDDSRTPSLSRAMGLEEEPDSFVCSECGADVPSYAEACPSCGEKFD